MEKGKCEVVNPGASSILVEGKYCPFFSSIALAHHGSCISGYNATNRKGKRNAGGEIRRACEAYTRRTLTHTLYYIETVKEMDRWIKGSRGEKGERDPA